MTENELYQEIASLKLKNSQLEKQYESAIGTSRITLDQLSEANRVLSCLGWNQKVNGGYESSLEELKANLKANKELAELWYYAMDEVPVHFEKIVCDFPPTFWMEELIKLKAKHV